MGFTRESVARSGRGRGDRVQLEDGSSSPNLKKLKLRWTPLPTVAWPFRLGSHSYWKTKLHEAV